MASIFDSLRSVPYVGDTIDSVSGRNGLETAAKGAKEAQAQANQLAQLQWQRQMQGLQEARGQTQPYLSLYDRIYGTQMAGHQTPVGGIAPGFGGPPPGADANGNPSPYSGTLRPDGTRSPTTRAQPTSFGGAAMAATSSPVYAPIMHGSPPPQNPAFPTIQAPNQQQTNPLEQLLMRLRGGV